MSYLQVLGVAVGSYALSHLLKMHPAVIFSAGSAVMVVWNLANRRQF